LFYTAPRWMAFKQALDLGGCLRKGEKGELGESINSTALEAAAVIRRTPGALEQWRRDPNHPLKWRYVDGRPLYRVDAVRDYLARCDKATKPSQPHNARGDGRAIRP
jgi:N-terminal domain of anti-restriction factor ArdC